MTWPWGHKHCYKIIQCGHYIKKASYYGVTLNGQGIQITEVLLRCGCGDVKTKELDGLWELDDLRAADRVDDEKFLKTLGVKV